jgi:hypothetical protein
MTLEEIRRSDTELRKILTNLGLTWVLHQVDEAIRAGHSVEKQAHILKDEETTERQETLWEEPTAPRRPGKPTLMMTLEPWTEAEQLFLLIDGIRRAIVHAAHIENEELRLLRTLGNVGTVQFESESEDLERRLLKLTGQTDERIDAVGKLLDSLEKEVRG